MKIAIYGLNEGAGGFGHVFINLINAFGRLGVDIDVVTHNRTIPDYDKVDPAIRRTVLGTGSALRKARLLSAYLKNEAPDIVLCDSNREKGSRILLLARFLARSRAGIIFRLGVPVTRIMAQRNRLNALLYLLSVRCTFSRADLIVANSKGVSDDLVRKVNIPPDKIRLMCNSTVSPVLEIMAEESLSDPWLSDPSVPTVVAAGRLRPQKDFDTLLRAFKIVVESRPCRLIILGEGSERGRLEKLTRELGLQGQVRLPGHVSNPFAYFRRSTLFVLSSRFEGAPNVLIEALSLGVPVVSTDCHSGPNEILEGGKYGRLVPVGDHKKMAESILLTLGAPLPADVLKKSVQRYDAVHVARQYCELFGDWSKGKGFGGRGVAGEIQRNV